MNAFEVSQSKSTGILIGVLDGLKGLILPLGARIFFGNIFWIQSAALMAGIIGHNYPFWLKFHGGRGLATAAGGFFIIGFAYTIVWCVTWFISYKILKDILYANLTAIFLTPLILCFIPPGFIDVILFASGTATEYLLLSFITSGVLLVSHVNVVKNLLKKEKIYK